MENHSLVREVFLEMLSGYEGDLDGEIVPALLEAAKSEAQRIEEHERSERIAARDEEVNEILEFAERLDELKEDEEGFAEIRIEFCASLLNRLDQEQRQSVLAQYAPPPQIDVSASGSAYASENERKPIPPASRQRDAGGPWPHTWTQERINEVDHNVKHGVSGIVGLRRRKRNGWKDPGKYANRLCLVSRHGWNPIVVPNGVEQVLRELGLWSRYKDKLPTDSKIFKFDTEDRFYRVEWERLPDGTRSFVKIVSSLPQKRAYR